MGRFFRLKFCINSQTGTTHKAIQICFLSAYRLQFLIEYKNPDLLEKVGIYLMKRMVINLSKRYDSGRKVVWLKALRSG